MSEVEKLSKEDMQKVRNCEYYTKTKQIMAAHEAYKHLSVGEVYSIKYKDYNDKMVYLTSYNDTRDKFMVVHMDEGFAFVKRINASGKLGQEIKCLTTSYPPPQYILEPDQEYVDALIFSTEDDYDPLAGAKELKKKKGQARRRNKKLQLPTFESATDAKAFLDTFKKGDVIYDAGTSYGSGVMEWTVESIETRPVDQTKPRKGWYSNNTYNGNTWEDRTHNEYGIKSFTKVKLKSGTMPHSRRWESSNRELIFSHFMKDSFSWTFYNTRPITTDDV